MQVAGRAGGGVDLAGCGRILESFSRGPVPGRDARAEGAKIAERKRVGVVLEERSELMTNGQAAGGLQMPKEFFTVSTFGTLGGSALVTWVVSGVLCSALRLQLGFVGLVVSIVVAYVGLLLSKERKPAQFVVTFFNGFLIYVTVVGGTSFLPYFNKGTAGQAQKQELSLGVALASPWVPDKNLVAATRNLLEIHEEQSIALEETRGRMAELEAVLERPADAVTRRELTASIDAGRRRLDDLGRAVLPRAEHLKELGLELRRR